MTSKNEIQIALKGAIADIEATLTKIPEDHFFYKSGEKWSIAENVQHLFLAVNPINIGLALPLFLLKIFGGSEKSRSYDTIVSLYQEKLSEGATASLPFIPKAIHTEGKKEKIISTFIKAHHKLMGLLSELTEEQLDSYNMPHPILGKITIREMLFFTLCHIKHHHNTIKKIIN